MSILDVIAIDRDTIQIKLLGSEDPQIRHAFVERYSKQLETFVDCLLESFQDWQRFDAFASKSLSGAHLSALLYGTLHSQLVSMKLLLCGLMVPAGNTQRYVLESIATSLLASKPSLGILAKYVDGKYSTTKSVDNVWTHCVSLGLNREAVALLKSSRKLYDQYSHPTHISMSALMTLDGSAPQRVLGGHYDEAKNFAYDKEIASRLSLVSTFPNLIYAINRNFRAEALLSSPDLSRV